MFDKLKELNELRKIQNQIKKEKVSKERDGVSVTVTGEMKVEYIKLNPELPVDKQQGIVKDLINEAFREIQEKLAKSINLFQ